MSGYDGEPEKMATRWISPSATNYRQQDALIFLKLYNRAISDPTAQRRAVERLAELAVVHNSVEARANLAMLAGKNLNDYILREGIINRRDDVKGREGVRHALVEEARVLLMNEDLVGYTALAAVAGYYPPESMDEIHFTFDPDYDTKNDFRFDQSWTPMIGVAGNGG